VTATEKTREGDLIERIERLDTGKLAMLRRGCGERDPVEGRCPWLVGLIHGVASEATAFLVASLLAQFKTADIRAGSHRIDGNFGATWKQAIAKTNSKFLERRFHILLDADYDPWTGDGDLMVRYSASKGVGIEWSVLLSDLKFWSQPEKRVQKRWARSFFATERSEDTTTASEEKE
jgi:CRISPR type I-E-associated protein CasB/Cse2